MFRSPVSLKFDAEQETTTVSCSTYSNGKVNYACGLKNNLKKSLNPSFLFPGTEKTCRTFVLF